MVDLFASTSGSDADWVVKLIDVYPDEVPSQPELGGYQLPIALDIFRGRYRDSLSAPTAIPVDTPQRYRFALPNADHVFLPGHRIMVQIQFEPVPALRPQPADLRAEHLRREAGRLSRRDDARPARRRPGERAAPPGRRRLTRHVAGRPMTPAAIEVFFARLAAATPDPATELDYTTPFTLLVAVVLSAQATDAGVNRATKGLFAAAPDPAAMVALGEDGIRHHIRTIGLFNTKARNVLALSAALIANHGGDVPADRAALEALPGVGRKTANVVLNEIFGAETCAVDTHIFRVANRTGLAPGPTPRAVENGLIAVIPAAYRRPAHHLLLLHGRYTCIARRPHCSQCIVADLCAYPAKTVA